MKDTPHSFVKKLFFTNTGMKILRFFIFLFNKIENIYLSWRHESQAVQFIKKVLRETEVLETSNEAFQIYSFARAAQKVPGDYAEIGVYKGGSAKLICEAKGERTIHLFDTFGGLPPITKEDLFIKEGQFSGTSLEEVKKYLSKYTKTDFYKGIFPATAKNIVDRKFAFVHLDMDLYRGTLDSLEFFYPRLNCGGIILSHDYSTLPGVRKAFDEFFRDKPEVVVPLASCQCLVVKLWSNRVIS